MKFDLISAFKMVLIILGLIGAYTVVQTIWLLVYGVVADVATGGSIEVHPVINNTINDSVATNAAFFTSLSASVTVIIGLVVLVVILIIFWPMLKAYMARTGSKGDTM